MGQLKVARSLPQCMHACAQTPVVQRVVMEEAEPLFGSEA
jgi:hypothetical protein